MKAKFEFELPEDNADFQVHVEASKLHSVVLEYTNWLRQRYKHTGAPSEAVEKEHEETKEAFYALLSEYEITTL